MSCYLVSSLTISLADKQVSMLLASYTQSIGLTKMYTVVMVVVLFVGCLTSQQHASVSQGRICSDKSMCCHTEIEAADPTFHLIQSQHTDTGPTSPNTDPITPGTWQGRMVIVTMMCKMMIITLELKRRTCQIQVTTTKNSSLPNNNIKFEKLPRNQQRFQNCTTGSCLY